MCSMNLNCDPEAVSKKARTIAVELKIRKELLSSLWTATSQFDNDALDGLLSIGTSVLSVRSSDGRGLAWWAFEYQNAYALAAVLVYGGRVNVYEKDLQGLTAVEMCSTKSACEVLLKKAESLAADIMKRRAQKASETAAEHAVAEAATKGLVLAVLVVVALWNLPFWLKFATYLLLDHALSCGYTSFLVVALIVAVIRALVDDDKDKRE